MNPRSSAPSITPNQQGFVLLEVLVSILIFSFGVLGILGVQASMIKHATDAKYRSQASYIAQQRLGQLWANPAGALAFREDTDISSILPGGRRLVERPVANGPLVITVTWQQPGSAGAHTFTTSTWIVGGG